jgi:hypothetical protein
VRWSLRSTALLVALALTPVGRASAQAAHVADSTATQPRAGTPAPATAAPSADKTPRLRERIERVRSDPNAVPLPPTREITVGPRTVPAGTRVAGPIATAEGTLDVYGEVTGDAIAIDGDVVVHPGAVVDGNALSVGGRVRADGAVRGEMRSLQGTVGAVPDGGARPSGTTTAHALKLALGWLAVLIVVGIGVLITASDYLDGVVDALERSVSRALVVGFVGQLAILPVLVLGVVGLAITLLGILLIPFAVVVYALAVAGLVTLGFLAVAQITGRSLRPVPEGAIISPRGEALRALVIGVTAYLLLWILAAAFTWSPLASAILRGIALAVTWVAGTAGLGAAILSRAGTRQLAAAALAEPSKTDEHTWMTPTPVTGVVAARRPTPAALHEPR